MLLESILFTYPVENANFVLRLKYKTKSKLNRNGIITCLFHRENPNDRSAKEIQHLGPATDFYKRLALDCSAQQIAVDLFVLNSQYCDIATLCKFKKKEIQFIKKMCYNLFHLPKMQLVLANSVAVACTISRCSINPRSCQLSCLPNHWNDIFHVKSASNR